MDNGTPEEAAWTAFGKYFYYIKFIRCLSKKINEYGESHTNSSFRLIYIQCSKCELNWSDQLK